MSTPGEPAPRSGGSHRAEPASGAGAQPASPLLLPVLSVLVVLGAIGLAAWMLVTADNGEEQVDQPPAATKTTPAPEPSDSASAEPTDDGGGDGGKDDDRQGGSGSDKDDAQQGKNDQDDQQAQPVPQIPVYVFNQTTITGLAAETGSQLEAAGWNVVGVDNWVGRVPTDTVYFYPGDRAAADRLSRDFPDIGRVWPASPPMPAGALTVILADRDRK